MPLRPPRRAWTTVSGMSLGSVKDAAGDRRPAARCRAVEIPRCGRTRGRQCRRPAARQARGVPGPVACRRKGPPDRTPLRGSPVLASVDVTDERCCRSAARSAIREIRERMNGRRNPSSPARNRDRNPSPGRGYPCKKWCTPRRGGAPW